MPTATVSKPTATKPSKAEQVAITEATKGNAGALLHRLKKFSDEFLYRCGSDLSFNDMRRAGFLSEELTTRECGEAVAVLARTYAEAIDELLPGIKK